MTEKDNNNIEDIAKNTDMALEQRQKVIESIDGLEPALEVIAMNTAPKEVQKVSLVAPEDEFDQDEVGKSLWKMLRGPKGDQGGVTLELPDGDKITERTGPIIVKGLKGEQGEQGIDGLDGLDGLDGENGKDGLNGKDGINGLDGKDGKDGKNGRDGSPDKAEDIKKKLESLPKGKGLDFEKLSNKPELPTLEKIEQIVNNRSQSSKTVSLVELDDVDYSGLTKTNGKYVLGSGGGGGITDGDKGDITVSSSGAVWDINADTIGLTELSATGTPSASTYLRGDNSWATISGGGDVTKVGTPVNNQVGVWTGDGTIEGDAALTYDSTTDTLTSVNFAGNLTGNVTGNVSGSSGSTTGNAATVTTNANLTGHVTSVGNAAVLGSFTKAQLTTAVSDGDPLYVGDVTTNATHTGDATGSGALTVVALNGTNLAALGTGVLKNTTTTGVPFISKVALTEPATAATLTIADNQTLTVNGSATITNGTHSGTNTGDQTSIVGITGSLAEFNTALTGADFATGGGTVTGASSGTNTGDQTITNSSDATSHTVTLSASGGTIQFIEGTNISLTTGGTAGAGTLTIAASGGSGDVTKVGTPLNNQMAVWTGDGTLEGTSDFTYDGTSLNLITGKNFQIAGATVLSDTTGTTTLQNIDALDATTEATIEGAIDTLANLTSVQGQTLTLAGAFITSGANSLTLTTTGATNVTLPTTGTLAILAGNTFTGVHDFGGATSLEIPNGAGGTTVDASGEICVDTTSKTVNFYDGAAEKVLTPVMSKSITIESPTATEDLSMFYTDDAITVTKIVFVITGSTSVTTTIRHHTDRNNAGNQVVTSGTVANSTTTGNVVTSFNDATIPADSFVWVETTALSGTPTSLNITIFYTQDA